MSKASQLFKRLGKLKCKGLCVTSCGPILMSEKEMRQVMIYAAQRNVFAETRRATTPGRRGSSKNLWTLITNDHLFCPLLSKQGICLIYPSRPMVCRVFGGVQHEPMNPRSKLRCPHGCTEEMEDPLTMEESDFLMVYAETHNLEIIERRMQKARSKNVNA